jgi:hypothetical protein
MLDRHHIIDLDDLCATAERASDYEGAPLVRPMSYGDAGTISPAVGTIRRCAGPPRASA